MAIQLRDVVLDKLAEFTDIELVDIQAKLEELDRTNKPLTQTQSIYPFSASNGDWWVRKIFDLKVRIFFSITKKGNIMVEWLDHRDDDTYEEALKIWQSRNQQ